MSRPCHICNHQEKEEINRRLVRGDSIAGISREFVVGEDALRRHRDNHLPAGLAASPTAQELASADILLNEVRSLEADTRRLRDLAEQQGDLRTALLGVDKALRCLELYAKIQGQIDDRPQIHMAQISIYASPEWLTVGRALVEELSGYPELKARIAARLMALQESRQ